jgi:hypothetical protein
LIEITIENNAIIKMPSDNKNFAGKEKGYE